MKALRPLAGDVSVVVIDMSKNFLGAIHAALPGVPVVADRFHVVKYVQTQLRKFRVRLGRGKKKNRGDLAGLIDKRALYFLRSGEFRVAYAAEIAAWQVEFPAMQAIVDATLTIERLYGCGSYEVAAAYLESGTRPASDLPTPVQSHHAAIR